MDSTETRERLIVGVMTGTSLDGLDAALVRVTGTGLSITPGLLRHRASSLGDLGGPLRAAAGQIPLPAGALATLAWRLGELHAQAIAELTGPEQRIDLVAAHGQTIYHAPPVSWQLINPAPIAQRHRCPVVTDLRQADLAAGGQGAPITPLADWVMFRDPARSRAVVNLGGFCNVSILPRESETVEDAASGGERAQRDRIRGLDRVGGLDVCACNQLLDAVARTALDRPFDEGGAAALAGKVHTGACGALQAVLAKQGAEGRSLGTGDEALDWVREYAGTVEPNDLAATAVQAIAASIVEPLRPAPVDQVVVAGGGARNCALVAALSEQCKAELIQSDALGMPIEAREATAMAILGALAADGVPITLPQVTGCSSPAPLAGAWHGRR